MPRYHLDLDAPPEWAPLERLCGLCAQHPELPHLRIGDFMYMGRLLAADHPAIHLFKQTDTRRYLYLDDQGHAFHARWVRDGAGGVAVTCAAWRSLLDALTAADALPEMSGARGCSS